MPSIDEDKAFYDQDKQAKFVHKNVQLVDAIRNGMECFQEGRLPTISIVMIVPKYLF